MSSGNSTYYYSTVGNSTQAWQEQRKLTTLWDAHTQRIGTFAGGYTIFTLNPIGTFATGNEHRNRA